MRKKTPFRLSPEQRREVYVAAAPVTPTVFVHRINQVVDTAAMEKLSVTRVNAWLLENGFVAESKQSAVVQRTVIRPLERAAQVGIGETEVTDPRTGEIKTRLVLSEQGQRFQLDNLEAILAGAERGPE